MRYGYIKKPGCHSTKFPCLDGKQTSRGREDRRREGGQRDEWLIVMLLSLKRAGQVL